MDGGNPAKVRIIHAAPIRCTRERMCMSDEARVSRISRSRPYAGMVERLQVAESSRFDGGMPFQVQPSDDDSYSHKVFPFDPANPMLRFLALRFARSIFPENFVDARELRISRRKNKLVFAMYSVHVADETGVMARRDASIRDFYSAKDELQRQEILDDAAKAEHASCPGLSGAARMAALAGIMIPHPEANYHFSDGKAVFFEVLGINLKKAYDALSVSPGLGEPIVLLSMIYAVALRSYARSHPGSVSPIEQGGGFDFDTIALGALCDLLEKSDSPTAYRLGFFRDMDALLLDIFNRAAVVQNSLVCRQLVPEFPVHIDHSLK